MLYSNETSKILIHILSVNSIYVLSILNCPVITENHLKMLKLSFYKLLSLCYNKRSSGN